MAEPLATPVKPRLLPVQTEDGGWSYRASAQLRTRDSYVNAFTNTGIGTQNASSAGTYLINPVTRQRMLLEWIYRGNWVARTIVDAVADDMTREGVEVQSEDDPKDLEKLSKGAESLQIWKSLGRAIKWGRLYGGSLAYVMIDGQDPASPLDIDSVKRDQFKGILPLDRWMAWPLTTDIISEPVPEFGLPRFYDLWPDVGTGLPKARIHYSRVIRFDGADIPYWQRIAENYWGLSVLEPIWDRIMAFDSATQGAAQLVYKAHLRTVKVKGLRELLGSNEPAAAVLKQFFDYVRMFQSSEGLTLLDGEDEFDLKTYSFEGLDDMILQFAQQVCGAEQIPLVRFFGQSPAGLNATGESDFRNYYDGIKARQERDLRQGAELVYALLYRSVLGRKPKDVYTLNFRSLWQMTDEQSAQVTSSIATAVATLVDKQVFNPALALKEIKTSSGVTNFGTNITDDDIEQAEADEKERRENPPDPLTGLPADDPANPKLRKLATEGNGGPRPNGKGATAAKPRTTDADPAAVRGAAS
jgi:uncharacterized protein